MTHAAPSHRSSSPAQLDIRDSPSYRAYQTTRKRELTRSRIINMRVNNRHLTLAEIAYHTGVSAGYVKEALTLDPLPLTADS